MTSRSTSSGGEPGRPAASAPQPRTVAVTGGPASHRRLTSSAGLLVARRRARVRPWGAAEQPVDLLVGEVEAAEGVVRGRVVARAGARPAAAPAASVRRRCAQQVRVRASRAAPSRPRSAGDPPGARLRAPASRPRRCPTTATRGGGRDRRAGLALLPGRRRRRDDDVQRRLELAAERRPDVGERAVLRRRQAHGQRHRQAELGQRRRRAGPPGSRRAAGSTPAATTAAGARPRAAGSRR